MRLLSLRASVLGLVALTLLCCAEFEGEPGDGAERVDAGDDASVVPLPEPPLLDGATDGPIGVPAYRARLIGDLNERPAGSAPSTLLVQPEYTLLLGNDGLGRRVWVTRGSAASTLPLPIEVPVRRDNFFVARADGQGGAFVFVHDVVSPQRPWGAVVWHTDGTVAGTRRVRDVALEAGRWVGTLPAYPGIDLSPGLFVAGSRFCLVSAQAGSSTSDTMLHCFGETGAELRIEGVTAVVEHEGMLLVGQQHEVDGARLLLTDGASAPTTLEAAVTLVAGASTPTGAVLLLRDGAHGDELARFSGGGLQRWNEPFPGEVSSVERIVESGDYVFASVYTNAVAPRRPLPRVTDGTFEGTHAFADPMPENDWGLIEIFANGPTAMFWASTPSGERTLYHSAAFGSADPLPLTTVTTQSFTTGFLAGVTIGSSTLFGLGLQASGVELWRSNAPSTALVRDLFENQSGMVGPVTPAGSSAIFACQTPATGPEVCATEGTAETTAVRALDPSAALDAATDASALLVGDRLLLAENASAWSPGGLTGVDLATGAAHAHDTATLLGARLAQAQLRPLGSDAAIVHFANTLHGGVVDPTPPLLRVTPSATTLDVTVGPAASQLGEATAHGVLVVAPPTVGWSWWGGTGAPVPLAVAGGAPLVGNAAFFRVGTNLLAVYSGTLEGVELFRVDDATLVPLVHYSALAQANVTAAYPLGDSLLVLSDIGAFRTQGVPDDFVEVDIPAVPESLIGAPSNVLNSGRTYHAAGGSLYRSIQRLVVTPLDLKPYEGLYAIRDGAYVLQASGRTRWARVLGETLIVSMQIDTDRRVRVLAVSAAGVETLADGIEFSGSGQNQLLTQGGRLYFTHDDGVHGRELWVTNGTKAGTMLTADIAPGSASAFGDSVGDSNRIVGPRGDALVLLADDFVHGTEPVLLEPGQ